MLFMILIANQKLSSKIPFFVRVKLYLTSLGSQTEFFYEFPHKPNFLKELIPVIVALRHYLVTILVGLTNFIGNLIFVALCHQ